VFYLHVPSLGQISDKARSMSASRQGMHFISHVLRVVYLILLDETVIQLVPIGNYRLPRLVVAPKGYKIFPVTYVKHLELSSENRFDPDQSSSIVIQKSLEASPQAPVDISTMDDHVAYLGQGLTSLLEDFFW